MLRSVQVFLLSTLAFLLSACAGGRHFHAIPAEGPATNAARYLELWSETRVATLHFPAGLYTLHATDDAGYYYQAPRKIAEHAPGVSVWHDGGIFVSKHSPRKLRGYVFWG